MLKHNRIKYLPVNILESDICETAFWYLADSRIFTKNIGELFSRKESSTMPNRCCYIKTGGVRCGAIALTEKQFCFWHNKINRHHAEAVPSHFRPKHYFPENDVKYRRTHELEDELYSGARANGPTADELPPLEDPESIQLAISMVLSSIADFRIETKRANLMLYALRLAMMNERRIRPAAENSVTDMVINEFGVEMAAPQLSEQLNEVVIPVPSAAEEPASAPAHAHDTSTNSPGFIMSPSFVSPSLAASIDEAA